MEAGSLKGSSRCGKKKFSPSPTPKKGADRLKNVDSNSERMSQSDWGLSLQVLIGISTNTVVPPYPLIRYPQFQLSAVYRGPKQKIAKLKK
jgi:hypothetical protein